METPIVVRLDDPIVGYQASYKSEPKQRPMSVVYLSMHWVSCEPTYARRLRNAGVENQRNNQPVETQHLGENEDKDHTNVQTGLLRSTAHTSITDNANGETGSKTSEADRETGTELDETGVERHGRLDWRSAHTLDTYCHRRQAH